MDLSDLVFFLDSELDTKNIPDYQNALNGLQLENKNKEIKKIATAVDASLFSINKAIDAKSQLLIVHHGIFWQGLEHLSGINFKKLQLAIENDLAIYSSHIPLDFHDKYGNNAQLASKLELSNTKPVLDWKGINMGLQGKTEKIKLEDFLNRVSIICGKKTIDGNFNGNCLIEDVVIVSGGAGGNITDIIRKNIKCDIFISGEGAHWQKVYAEEHKLNLCFAGHYHTETHGVQAIGSLLAEKFNLDHTFIFNEPDEKSFQ